MGLPESLEKDPPAILVHPQHGLKFTVDQQIGNNLLLLCIVDLPFCEPKLIFQGPLFLCGYGDPVEVAISPC